MNITPEHLLFIPSVLFLGWVIGFLMGKSGAGQPKQHVSTGGHSNTQPDARPEIRQNDA